MSSRGHVASQCILLKQVPDFVDENTISYSILSVQHISEYNELGENERRWIVKLNSKEGTFFALAIGNDV